MPATVDSPATPLAATPAINSAFEIQWQKVWLDINPLQVSHSITGRTEILIRPQAHESRVLRLNCRQARITRLATSLGKTPTLTYQDPYTKAVLPQKQTVHQWHQLQARIDSDLKLGQETELQINFGKIRYPEIPLEYSDTTSVGTLGLDGVSLVELSEFSIFMDFEIDHVRDGLQYVGCDPEDQRYPHVYTHAFTGSAASSLFPCLDNGYVRHEWEITIRTPRTIGDALSTSGRALDEGLRFSQEDKARDLLVICSGELTDEILDKKDSSRKETTFRIDTAILAQHVGFAIGPFEQVNLSVFRESGEDDRLGKSAIQIHGFCLPGRTEEVRNTCFPVAKTIDYYVETFKLYPFKSYKMAFVDDMIDQGKHCMSLSVCSTRILFPEDILEPMNRVTRYLAFCVASQWFGVKVVPVHLRDTWVVVGLAYFMADCFMKKLAGLNEYRYFQKRQADRVFESDVKRPSLLEIGTNLWLDPSQMEFLELKGAMVMFILDRRLTKANGKDGLHHIIFRLCLQSSSGELNSDFIDTERFMRTCEKYGHLKFESFFQQWVEGAGCPHFQVTQRFNKKRLVVEMQIKQVQHEASDAEMLKPEDFIRDVREETNDVWASEVQNVFRGPMTIRIHEADGTPYEHIVEIKDMITRIEIPYNTKYKRLKRTRRNKEKLAQGASTADEEIPSGLYMLGDNLQTEGDVAEWRLTEFTKEDEDRMNSESFEWIRMDADFEWICRMQFNMPPHMYLSQLQQDRDVVAQLESITYFANSKENPLVSTFLVRTLMDKRYFYGIRSAAATALSRHAKDEVSWIGLHHLIQAFKTLFCLPNGLIRPNDFSDRALHYIQCAIVRSMGIIRDNSGRAPYQVRKFLYETLRYNDNSENEYSDAHFLQAVMRALGSALASAPPLETDVMDTDFENADDIAFSRACLEEIDRHRRLDEWLPSYHNVLTMEGLNARSDLMRAGRIPWDAREFLRYTQVVSHGDVRVAAFHHLLDLGFGSNSKVLSWFLFNLGHDTSAYVRKRLMTLFGRWLGMIATGQLKPKAAPVETANEGLVLETDAAESTRDADEARKKTVDGALAALKVELASDESLETSLWDAVCSSVPTLYELGMMLEVCSWLYETKDQLVMNLQYPRYWQIRVTPPSTLPDGSPTQIICFKRTDRVRTKILQKWVPPVEDTIVLGPKIGAKRKSSTLQGDFSPAPKANKVQKRQSSISSGHAAQQPGMAKPSLKLKLKMPNQGTPPPTARTPGVQTPGGSTLKLKLKPPTPGPRQ